MSCAGRLVAATKFCVVAALLAGCSESLADRIVRECDEAAEVYFAAKGHAAWPVPRPYVDPAAGAAYERERRKLLYNPDPNLYPMTEEGDDRLMMAQLGGPLPPPRREPTEAERAQHEAQVKRYRERVEADWKRECQVSKARKAGR